MAASYRIPPAFSESKPYARWVEEIRVWQTVTDLDDKKQGPAIALSLPETEGGVRDKVFSEIGVDKLNCTGGADALITFLDKIYKKDELAAAYDMYTDFDRYKRTNEQMEMYVTEFEKLYNRLKKFGMSLPESVLAFKLLDGACLEHKDRQLVLTGVNYNDKENLFKQMTLSLKKFFGRQSIPAVSDSSNTAPCNIKVEPAYYAAEEEAYYTNRFRGRRRNFPPRGTFKRRALSQDSRTRRVTNPLGYDGQPLKCKICESKFHFARTCPDSYENMERRDKEDEITLFTGSKAEEMQVLLGESINAAVLDSGCSSNVTGETWIRTYLDTLDEENLSKVKKSESSTTFKFGDGKRLQSKGKVTFPCQIAGKQCNLTTDVVESDIPLLLSKPSMKSAKMVIDLENDTANIFGQHIDLQCTSSGHYCIPLGDNLPVNRTLEVLYTMDDKSEEDKRKILLKLHKQFAHPTSRRLTMLLKDAGTVDKNSQKLIEEISENCDTCKRYKKTPARPVVCLPLANELNEVVAMDLKEWKKGVYFLHLIDLATRFSLATVINDKKPATIINKVMTLWIGSGMGPPKRFLADNGGEFANDEYRDMAENLNIEVWNSAGMSPWQNGICERNHAVVDDCVKKILADNPGLDLEIALVWAVNAKNSLHMVHGWSPYQLVFGFNPNLPSVLNSKPPALEGRTISQRFADHLNALHAGRQAYIQAESSERIRRALRHQIRASGTVFQTGDSVYYKRDDQWKGPGKVLGQDGKVVFVRHGSVYVRVHPCRLIKVGEEFKTCDETPLVRHPETVETKQPEVDDTEECPKDALSNQIQPEITQETQEHISMLSLPKPKQAIRYKLKGANTWVESEVISRGGKATGKNRSWFNVRDKNSTEIKAVDFQNQVDQWQTSNSSDSIPENLPFIQEEEVNVVSNNRSESHAVREAKRLELENWKNFKVYDEVVDHGQPRISTRWVITEKQSEGKTVTKARLVARGFEEQETVQTDSPTAGKETLRSLIAVSGSCGWQCRTIDIKAAFLQGNTINREMFLIPPTESDGEDSLWKLNKCVYGLSDASRSWYFSVRDELIKYGCQQSQIDPALFYLRKDHALLGLFLMHVDDFIWSGTSVFKENVIDKLQQTFRVGSQESGMFRYIGLSIKHEESSISMDQYLYIDSLQPIPLHGNRASQKSSPLNKDETTKFRSIVGQIMWLVNQTRPDIAFDALELSMAMKDPKIEDVLKANKVLKKLKLNDCHMNFPKLGEFSNLRLSLFCDASYANLGDGVSSASGHIVFLTGENDLCCPIVWKSCKIRRIVKSSLAAETLSMVDGLDSTLYVGHLLSEIMFGNSEQNMIPVDCYTDNKSLHDNIHSTKLVNEKRLRIDIASIKQMLQRDQISRVTWVETGQQISDCLTKRGASCEKLVDVLKRGKLRL